ncbi:hypothetical protein NDU88_007133 [Pleurodeles waltl]|uniref:Uncharacterized protein n=1 Tax=Pleurodeles waltl TaxID=8319 RepID=A0AAV7UQ61_PLEWA|nr:hypothetical protein NDU88_007133 [Pleurodeles waltl]
MATSMEGKARDASPRGKPDRRGNRQTRVTDNPKIDAIKGNIGNYLMFPEKGLRQPVIIDEALLESEELHPTSTKVRMNQGEDPVAAARVESMLRDLHSLPLRS